ncbi:VOC family protein [Streptomyces sp. NBC_00178]|uniref:VOC family protein n=1 Tax=Streptomyces sp. NBC_00178 TaxID=2975672 RepID=UPI002E29869F|nr:VOC family protein [Streptomyces sp. NBC_00178]
MTEPQGEALEAIRRRQEELKVKYLAPAADRPKTAARGIHHAAFICRDVEETILFYRDIMGFPLVELFENRDYAGSTHFFMDVGNGNLLAFFDFPGHPHPDYAEAIGGIHHLCLSVTEENFATIVGRLREHDIEFMEIKGDHGLNLFVADPNGLRIELATEKLGYAEGEYLL